MTGRAGGFVTLQSLLQTPPPPPPPMPNLAKWTKQLSRGVARPPLQLSSHIFPFLRGSFLSPRALCRAYGHWAQCPPFSGETDLAKKAPSVSLVDSALVLFSTTTNKSSVMPDNYCFLLYSQLPLKSR